MSYCTSYQNLSNPALAIDEAFLGTLFAMIPLIYLMPTIFLQLLILGMIVTSPKLWKKPFYKIVTYTFVLGIFCIIFPPVATRLGDVPFMFPFFVWLIRHPTVAGVFVFIMFYSAYGMSFGVLLLAANRSSVAIWPVWAVDFWKEHTTKVILLCCAVPLFFIWQVFYAGPCVYEIKNRFYRLDYHGEKLPTFLQIYYSGTIVGILCFSFTTFCNIRVFWSLLKTKATKRHETKLAVYAVIVGSAQLVYIVAQVIIALVTYSVSNDESASRFFLRFLPFVGDAFIVTHCWSLLFMSSDVKQQLRRVASNFVGSLAVSSSAIATVPAVRMRALSASST